MPTNSLHITINVDILPPVTIADIANALLHEIKETNGNHENNSVIIKCREMHREIVRFLAETHGEEWLDLIQS